MPTENKRILALCSTGYFNDRGCHVRILQVAKELQRRNEVTLLCHSTGRDIEGQRIFRIKRVFADERDYIGFSLKKMALDFFLALKSFQMAKSGDYDLLYCFTHEAGLIGLLTGKAAGKPYMLDYQGSLSSEMAVQNPLFGRFPFRGLLKAAEKIIELNASAVVYNTKSAYEKSDNRGKLLFEDDSSVFEGTLKNEEKMKNKKFKILWVGVMTRVQGIEEFSEMAGRILEKYSEAEVEIAGFPVTSALKAGLERFGARVRFLGRVPFDRMPALVSSADLCVSTKKESTEGSSKLHLYRKFGRDAVALRNTASEEILKAESLASSFGELEKMIEERIENAHNASS